MSLYIMSYDLHLERDYSRLYELMDTWNAVRLLESVWLAELLGPATLIRQLIRGQLDGDDSIAVIELRAPLQWATRHCEAAGVDWLEDRIPYFT